MDNQNIDQGGVLASSWIMHESFGAWFLSLAFGSSEPEKVGQLTANREQSLVISFVVYGEIVRKRVCVNC